MIVHISIILLVVALMIVSVTAIDLTALLSAEENRERLQKTKLPFGHLCKSDSECRHKLQDKFSDNFADQDSVCKNGRCDCAQPYHIREFRKGNYRCTAALDVMRYHSLKNFRFCYPKTATCIGGTCKRVAISSERRDWQCFCGNDTVLVEKTCRKILWSNHSDDCTTPDSGEVPVCDNEKNLHCDTNSMKCACFKNFFYDTEGSNCVTAKTYVHLYPNETLGGLGESCGIVNNIPKRCDDETMSCTNSTCKCQRAFYPVKINGTCESKQAFATANNLKSYKVKPGDYCDNVDECITGLICYKNLCDCPHPCTYERGTITCDCGKVSHLEGAGRAILVGVIGGFGIIIFWYYMILNTMKEGGNGFKFNSNYDGVTRDLPPDSTAAPDSSLPYSLQPTTSPYLTSVPTFLSPSYNSEIPASAPSSPPPSYNSLIPASAPTPPPPSYNSAFPASAPTSPHHSYTPMNQNYIYKPIIS